YDWTDSSGRWRHAGLMDYPAETRFWEHLAMRFGELDMLLDAFGQCWTYQQCSEQISRFADKLSESMPERKALCALSTRNNPASVVAYLACLQAGHALMLLPPQM